MRPRKADTRNSPPRMHQWTRTRKSGKVWISYFYLDLTGKAIPLGKDLDQARIKWAELEAKEKPLDLRTMKGIFDRYIRDIVPKKAPRTQRDNLAEIKQLRTMFNSAPIESITPATIAGYRDARSAKVRANREIATLSHIFNIAREWGLTSNAWTGLVEEIACQAQRKGRAQRPVEPPERIAYTCCAHRFQASLVRRRDFMSGPRTESRRPGSRIKGAALAGPGHCHWKEPEHATQSAARPAASARPPLQIRLRCHRG